MVRTDPILTEADLDASGFEAGTRRVRESLEDIAEAGYGAAEGVDDIGAASEEAGERAPAGLAGISAALRDVRVQALLAVAAVRELIQLRERLATEEVQLGAYSDVLGLGLDETQALGLTAEAAGLEGARDVAEVVNQAVERALEPSDEDLAAFGDLGIDPETFVGLDTFERVGYLQRQLPEARAARPGVFGARLQQVFGDEAAVQVAQLARSGLTPQAALGELRRRNLLRDEADIARSTAEAAQQAVSAAERREVLDVGQDIFQAFALGAEGRRDVAYSGGLLGDIGAFLGLGSGALARSLISGPDGPGPGSTVTIDEAARAQGVRVELFDATRLGVVNTSVEQ